jgi:response regulator of citrate/malate metabolism
MKENRKKVLCIDADYDFLYQQQKYLKQKKLDKYFFPYSDFWDALNFIEKEIIEKNEKLHYILLDENILGDQRELLLDKISEFKNYLNNPEIIFCTANNDSSLRNQVMQNKVISAFLVKPVPGNYIEFLIDGY